MLDAIIVGAGPCGIATGITLKQAGLKPLLIEKGCLVNSIYHFPLRMTFFSSPEKIEIGGIPFTTVHDKPTRDEALKYYRICARYYDLQIKTYEKVTQILPHKGSEGFTVHTTHRHGTSTYQAKYVIVATGYYDTPNYMNVPGEDQPHVYHYFREAHPFADQNVVVIGGKNSAIDVALELQIAGANVTMVYRRKAFSDSVKPWIKPVIESAIRHQRIKMMWGSEVLEILSQSVRIKQGETILEIPADSVFAMTGYRPDLELLKNAGAEIDPETEAPIFSEHMETTVPGLYICGVIAAGKDASKVFIENGRFHGEQIVKHILAKASK